MDPYNYSVEIMVALGAVSSVCSIITLYVIYLMGRWNNYLQLVVSLTVCQLIYDISIMMIPGATTVTAFETMVSLRCIFGIAGTLWTNVISFVVFYVVVYLRVINVAKLYPYFAVMIMVPSIMVGILVPIGTRHPNSSLFFGASKTYYGIRLISILTNIVIYFLLTYQLYRREKIKTIETAHGDPVKALAYRMKYYPIVQIICRIGASWYEQVYGYEYSYKNSYSTIQKTSLLLYSITLPSAGIGFFIIFMVVSPGAFRAINRQMKKYCPFCFNKETGAFDHDDSTSNEKINVLVHSRSDSFQGMAPGISVAKQSEVSIIDYAYHDEDQLEDEISRIYGTSGATSTSFLFMSSGRTTPASRLATSPDQRESTSSNYSVENVLNRESGS